MQENGILHLDTCFDLGEVVHKLLSVLHSTTIANHQKQTSKSNEICVQLNEYLEREMRLMRWEAISASGHKDDGLSKSLCAGI